MADNVLTPSRLTLPRRAKRPSIYEDEVPADVAAAAVDSTPKTPRRRATTAAAKTPKSAAAATRTPRARKTVATIDVVAEELQDEQQPAPTTPTTRTPRKRTAAIDTSIYDLEVPKKVSRTPGKKSAPTMDTIVIPDTPVPAPLHPAAVDAKPKVAAAKTPRKSRAPAAMDTIVVPDTPTPLPTTTTTKTPRKSRAVAAAVKEVALPAAAVEAAAIKTSGAKTPRKRAASMTSDTVAAPKTPSTRATRKRATRAELDSKTVAEEEETADDATLAQPLPTIAVVDGEIEVARAEVAADVAKEQIDEKLAQPITTIAAVSDAVAVVDEAEKIAEESKPVADQKNQLDSAVEKPIPENSKPVAEKELPLPDSVGEPMDTATDDQQIDASPSVVASSDSIDEIVPETPPPPTQSANQSVIFSPQFEPSAELPTAEVRPDSDGEAAEAVAVSAVSATEADISEYAGLAAVTPNQTADGESDGDTGATADDVAASTIEGIPETAETIVEDVAAVLATADDVQPSGDKTSSSSETFENMNMDDVPEKPPATADSAAATVDDEPRTSVGLSDTFEKMDEGPNDVPETPQATTEAEVEAIVDEPRTSVGLSDTFEKMDKGPSDVPETPQAKTEAEVEATVDEPRTSVGLSDTFEKMDEGPSDVPETPQAKTEAEVEASVDEPRTSVGLSDTFEKMADEGVIETPAPTEAAAAAETSVGLSNTFDESVKSAGLSDTFELADAPAGAGDQVAVGSIDLTAADNTTFDSHAAATAAGVEAAAAAAGTSSPSKPPVSAAVPSVIVIPDTPAAGRPLDTTFSPEPSSPPRANSTTRKVAAGGRLLVQTPRAVAALRLPLKGIRKRSFSVDASPAGGRTAAASAVNKSVIFHSPSNQQMPIDQIDLLMEASRRDQSTTAAAGGVGGKENRDGGQAATKRRKRSLSMVEADRRGMYNQRATPVKRLAAAAAAAAMEASGGARPTPKKTRIPDFQQIHQRNFDRMESIADYKIRLAGTGGGVAPRARIVKPVVRNEITKATRIPTAVQKTTTTTTQGDNKTRTLAAIQANLVKPVCFKSKLPTTTTTMTTSAAAATAPVMTAEPAPSNAAETATVTVTTSTTTAAPAAWQPPKMTMPPSFAFGSSISSASTSSAAAGRKPTDAQLAISRLAERQAKHRALVKGGPAGGGSGSSTSAAAGGSKPADVKERQSQMLRGVRSNRRFELQMKFRQQNDD